MEGKKKQTQNVEMVDKATQTEEGEKEVAEEVGMVVEEAGSSTNYNYHVTEGRRGGRKHYTVFH